MSNEPKDTEPARLPVWIAVAWFLACVAFLVWTFHVAGGLP